MRISGWSIDGFGHFSGYEEDAVPGGLVVLFGENEAGKSTLLAFLRGVLFGFPGRRGGEPRYEPLQGGRHGGRVFLDAHDGRWIVDREVGRRGGATVTSPAGLADEDALRALLGGADATLFRNVFAFGLQELQALESLSGQAVRSRIFAAGLVGAGRSAREVVRALGGQADALFASTRAHSREIPRLQKELRLHEDQLRQARAELGRHGQLLREEAGSAARVDELAESIRRLRREDSRLRLLLDAWPAWSELAAAEKALAGLEPVARFPSDASARLERALAEARAATEREGLAREEWRAAACERRQAIRGLDVRLRPVRDGAERCHEQRAVHRARLGESAALAMELRGAQSRLADKLRDLGPHWDEGRLDGFDVSLPRQTEIREWDQELVRAEVEARDAEREAESAGRRRAAALAEHERRREQLALAPEVDPQRLSAEEAALGRIRAGLGDLRAAAARREAQEQIADERRRALRQADAGGGQPRGPVARWLAAAALVALAAAVPLALAGAVAFMGIAAAVALAAGAAALALRSVERRAEAADAAAASARAAREAELAAAEGVLAELRAQEDRLRDAVLRDAAVLGLGAVPSAAEVEERAGAAAGARQVLARRAALEEALRDASEALAQAEREQQRLHTALEARRTGLAGARNAWRDWKAGAGLPAALAPAGALDFLREAQEARGWLRERDALLAKLRRLHAEITPWEEEVLRLLARAGMAAPARGEPLAAALDELFARSEADARARARCEALRQAQLKHKLQLRAASHAAQRARAGLAALLAEGRAADEAAFRRRMAAFDERSRLEARIRELDAQLTGRLGADDDGAAVRAELATGRVQAWGDARARNADAITELESQRDEAIRRNAALSRERQELERSADVPRLQAEVEMLSADLAAATRRWAVVTLARSLVEETLERYMAERQPGVLRGAGRQLARVTGGRYVGVMQDGEGESFVVLDAAGRARGPEGLSRGTAEQLYLSLRLALAEEFARHGAALPLVMDDVLVNFDLRRAGATAEALAEMAETRQVLVFTCHRSTARTLRRSGATVLPIGGAPRRNGGAG